MTGWPDVAVTAPDRPPVRWRPLVSFRFWADGARLDIATRGIAYADGYGDHWCQTARAKGLAR